MPPCAEKHRAVCLRKHILKGWCFEVPYVSIKAYPKDEAIKRRVAERINQVLLEEWGCPQKAISISIEEFAPEEFEEKVTKPEIEPKVDKMLIYWGEKR